MILFQLINRPLSVFALFSIATDVVIGKEAASVSYGNNAFLVTMKKVERGILGSRRRRVLRVLKAYKDQR
jgi:hypothetical protein